MPISCESGEDDERVEYHQALLKMLIRSPDGEARAKRYLQSLEPALRNAILR